MRKRQKATEGDTGGELVTVEHDGLSASQHTALMALVGGQTVTEAASLAGVARQTVSEWYNQEPAFIAAYNRARQQLWAEHELRLSALMGNALDALEDIMGDTMYEQAPHRLKAALAVLAMGREKGRPGGHTTAEEVRQAQEDAEEARLIERLTRGPSLRELAAQEVERRQRNGG